VCVVKIWQARRLPHGHFVPQMGAGLDSAVEVGEVEFFIGLCVLSSSRPQPSRSVLLPSCCRKLVTIGIEPPSRDEHRRLAETPLDRRWAAATNGLSSARRRPEHRATRSVRPQPQAACGRVRTREPLPRPLGILIRHQSKAEFSPGPGGNRRLADLLATQMPCTSNVGRAQRRSSVVKPSSPAAPSRRAAA
jgi:hypothetical protein